MEELELQIATEELECLKEKKEMYRSASLLMKTVAAVIIFASVLAIIGLLAGASLLDKLVF